MKVLSNREEQIEAYNGICNFFIDGRYQKCIQTKKHQKKD